MPSKKKAVKSSFTRKEKKQAYIRLSKRVHLSTLEIPDAAHKPNFEYTLTLSSVSLSLLDINGTVVTPIKTSDKVYADRGRPFYLEVRASLLAPVGNGTIQLKDLVKNKDVFAAPQPLQFGSSGNGGLFLEDVKLP